jgi:hypothetical protein
MVSFRQGTYSIIWNDVGVRSSHIISEVTDTAGTCAIGGDHVLKKGQRRRQPEPRQQKDHCTVHWEGDFNKQFFL